MIHLCTGITPNYLPRATPFLDSLVKHANIPVAAFAVDFGSPLYQLPCVMVDYAKCPLRLPKFMLQTGGFTHFVDWPDGDVVIFTDADAVLQRPFTDEEKQRFSSVWAGEFLVGYNMPNQAQTLAQEAPRLSPKMPVDEIETLWPGIRGMACRNFGFVVARMSAWRKLLAETIALESLCAFTFDNPARVQFMACYAIQRGGYVMSGLSPVTHAHGHCGLKDGLTKGEDGLWRQDGEVVAFAHAL